MADHVRKKIKDQKPHHALDAHIIHSDLDKHAGAFLADGYSKESDLYPASGATDQPFYGMGALGRRRISARLIRWFMPI
jgi:hypothetical protein